LTVRVLAVLALLVAAAPLAAAASTYSSSAWLEGSENPQAPGQANCVAEAWHGLETSTCFYEIVKHSKWSSSRSMMRMLDLVYMASGVATQAPESLMEPIGPGTPNNLAGSTSTRGGNLHRASGGVLPDVIWPGAGTFEGWYGYWADTNPDGIIRNRVEGDQPTLDSEWLIDSRTFLAAFVDPGAHPQFLNSERPRDTTPDIVFQSATNYGYYTSRHGDIAQVGGLIVFLDGSLLQDVTVTAVSDPVLAPDGERPFTARPTSLVDVDRHPAAAPGPVAALYAATAGPAVNAVGSPSLGYCPGGCRIGPAPLGTAASPVTEPVADGLYAPYPREWQPGSLSTNEDHGLAYRDAYHAWIDLLPRWGPGTAEASAAARPGPLAGRAADGSQAALPGYVGFEMRIGVWRDHNGDGFIGVANPEDPYEGGTRPLPDDYYNAGVEYFPTAALDPVKPSGNLQNLRLYITPLSTWGPIGAFITTSGSGTMLFLNTNGGDPLAYHYEGDEPIQLELRLDSVVQGRYAATRNLFLPQGTMHGGFLACTQDIGVRFQDAGADVTETVRDCDVIGQLA